VKNDIANKFKTTGTTLPENNSKPTTKTTLHTIPPLLTTRRPKLQPHSTDRTYPTTTKVTTTRKVSTESVIYCNCSNVLCKIDRFVGSRLYKCKSKRNGILQKITVLKKIPGTIKKVGGKAIDYVSNAGKRLINNVVDKVSNVGKTVFNLAVDNSVRYVSNVGKGIFRIGKSLFSWI